METVVCKHEEGIVSGPDGMELGTCRHCDQEIQYNTRDLKAKPILTKLGRIDGKVVLPNPVLSTSLLSEADRLDLKEARKFIPKATEESSAEVSPSEADRATEQSTAGVPPRPRKKKQLRAYFEKHKEAILADYYAMGRLDFFKRWGISAATWAELHREWGVTLKGQGGRRKGTTKRLAPEKRQALTAPEGLPPFPPFSDSWEPAVQIEWLHEWLHTYRELKLAGGKGV